MVRQSRKIAFSLAEAVMSMIIISITAICMLPVLSKMRPGAGVNPNTLMGAFICYYEGDELKSAYFEGRRQIDDVMYSTIDGDKCILKENKRAGRFYILAAGAGSDNVPGQVITQMTLEMDGDFHIRPGKTGNSIENGATTVRSSHEEGGSTVTSGESIIAYPGFEDFKDNGIMPNNVARCKVTGGGTCPNLAQPEINIAEDDPDAPGDSCQETVRKPIGCEVATLHDEANNLDIYAFKVSGCSCTNALGKQHTEEYSYSYIDSNGHTQAINMRKPLDIVPVNEIKKIDPPGFAKYTYDKKGIINFNVDLKDSSYGNEAYPDESHMSKILSNMNALRQNAIIDKLINLKPGAKGNKGAVVIMW